MDYYLNTQNFDAENLLGVLSEIEAVMDTAEYDDCIVQGDLNWDSDRQSGFSKVLRNFCERVGLHSVWDIYPRL